MVVIYLAKAWTRLTCLLPLTPRDSFIQILGLNNLAYHTQPDRVSDNCLHLLTDWQSSARRSHSRA